MRHHAGSVCHKQQRARAGPPLVWSHALPSSQDTGRGTTFIVVLGK